MRSSLCLLGQYVRPLKPETLIQITRGTFYRQHPNAEDNAGADSNPPLFRDLSFELPAKPLFNHHNGKTKQQHWAVVGASGTSTFLEILRGTHLCFPPTARSFPYLSSDEIEAKDHRLRVPSRAIQYVGFNAGKGQGLGGGIRGAYLSARYESRREDDDWSVLQYLKGETDLNPAEDQHEDAREDSLLLGQVMKDLRLEEMSNMPVSNLSNGQTRRARIAKALLGKPELLLLDEPFSELTR
jgi:ATPase subunit of ABC transporter with duplicated ATPase domains